MLRSALSVSAALLVTAVPVAPALADEVWTTDMGEVVYEDEQNGAAIFSFTNVDAYPATLVIPGLAGNYSQRGVHQAYWIGTGAGYCDAFLGMPGGREASSNWGRAVVSFDGPAFPTSFTMTLGDCFGPLTYALRAEAR